MQLNLNKCDVQHNTELNAFPYKISNHLALMVMECLELYQSSNATTIMKLIFLIDISRRWD